MPIAGNLLCPIDRHIENIVRAVVDAFTHFALLTAGVEDAVCAANRAEVRHA